MIILHDLFTNFRFLLTWAVTVWLFSQVLSQQQPCTIVNGGGDDVSHPYPDFKDALNEPYTMVLEMTDLQKVS